MSAYPPHPPHPRADEETNSDHLRSLPVVAMEVGGQDRIPPTQVPSSPLSPGDQLPGSSPSSEAHLWHPFPAISTSGMPVDQY